MKELPPRNERGRFISRVEAPTLPLPVEKPVRTNPTASQPRENRTFEALLPKNDTLIPKEIEKPKKKKKDASKSKDWKDVLEERQVKREMQNPQVAFEKPDKEPITWQEHIVYMKERQARLNRLEKSQDEAKVEITSPLPIGIVLTSDWHLGGQGTDYELWQRHMEMIKNEPNAYMIPLGNTIDNFIWPGGMWSQMENPDIQMEMVKQFAHDYKGKFLGIVGSRCHEGWAEDKVNINPYEAMFVDEIEHGTPFLSKGGVIHLKLRENGQAEGIDYTLGLVHKSRFNSSLNVTNPNKRIHDLRWPADVVAIAHNHTSSVEHTTRWEGSFTKEFIAIRTGTYKIDDSYSESEGFGKGQQGGSMIVLDPKEKRIVPFKNLEDGMRYLKAIRELDNLK
jgi:hypothetical protein